MTECTPQQCQQPGPRGGRCPTCVKARALQRYYDNHEARAEYNAKWRAQNREYNLAQLRAYYHKHPERWAARYQAERETRLANKRAQRAANPGGENHYSREWRKRNPEKWALRNRENQRRRRRADGVVVSYAQILETYGMTCHICCATISSFGDLHFDHVVPLSKGGLHALENIKPAHALCNLRKSDKT